MEGEMPALYTETLIINRILGKYGVEVLGN